MSGMDVKSISIPEYGPLRMTIPVREALARAGNMLHPDGSAICGAPLFRVMLRSAPGAIVQVLIGHGREQHEGLRLRDEPPYPGEWPDGEGVAWADQAHWTACSECGASLVWWEAGYVPGWRMCLQGHASRLSDNGRAAHRMFHGDIELGRPMSRIVTALYRDEQSGLCHIDDIEIDSDGIPVTSYGYVFRRVGTPEHRPQGWFDGDPACVEWAHNAGAYSVLIPEASR